MHQKETFYDKTLKKQSIKNLNQIVFLNIALHSIY